MTTDQQQVPRLATAGAAADPRRQAAADEDALRVLSIFYFAYGGMAAAFSLVGLAFLFAGTIFGSHGAWWGRPEEQAGAAIAGCFFVAVGSGLFVFLGVTALLRILVGVALRRRRYYTFCLVAAGLTCFDLPLGTALGVATLIVLLRPSTERLFSGLPPIPPSSPSSAVAPPPRSRPGRLWEP